MWVLVFLKRIGNVWDLNNISVWGECVFWFLLCQILTLVSREARKDCLYDILCLKQVLKLGFILFIWLSVDFYRFAKARNTMYFLKKNNTSLLQIYFVENNEGKWKRTDLFEGKSYQVQSQKPECAFQLSEPPVGDDSGLEKE